MPGSRAAAYPGLADNLDPDSVEFLEKGLGVSEAGFVTVSFAMIELPSAG